MRTVLLNVVVVVVALALGWAILPALGISGLVATLIAVTLAVAGVAALDLRLRRPGRHKTESSESGR